MKLYFSVCFHVDQHLTWYYSRNWYLEMFMLFYTETGKIYMYICIMYISLSISINRAMVLQNGCKLFLHQRLQISTKLPKPSPLKREPMRIAACLAQRPEPHGLLRHRSNAAGFQRRRKQIRRCTTSKFSSAGPIG